VTLVALTDITIGTQLGSGHFGTVHVGALQPHGEVAIKILDCKKMEAFLRISVSDWDLFRAKLFAEADALKRAQHENVVQVFAVHYDASKNNVFIVTERCESSIEARIKHGPLPLAVVKSYARHALSGLENLHMRGMIHRDIKPGNILIKAGRAKLSDFGLVTDNLVAGYASSVGYVDHLAPEVLSGGGSSMRSDVWAMGMTLYRLLNGEPWYREVRRRLGIDHTVADPIASAAAATRAEQLVLKGGFAKRLTFMPPVPDSWRRFVRKAMHDDKNMRFRDGAHMLSAMTLPDGPSYNCDMGSPDVIRWSRQVGDREEVVTWERSPSTAQRVAALTRPIAPVTGIKRWLLREKTLSSGSAAIGELQAFFATRSR
jgi:serine/threonine protein kinase